MRKATTLFVGLDVHKDFISVAHAEAHRIVSVPCITISQLSCRLLVRAQRGR